MIRSLTIIAAGLVLTACATTEKPLVVTNTQYVPVSVSPELLNLDSCPWPQATVFIPTNKESEVIDYILEGYKAWTCENDTRGTIKKQVERQEAEIKARNDAKAKPPEEPKKKGIFGIGGKKDKPADKPAGAEARLLEQETPIN